MKYSILGVMLCFGAMAQHKLMPSPVSYTQKIGSFIVSPSQNVTISDESLKPMVEAFAPVALGTKKVSVKTGEMGKGRQIFIGLHKTPTTVLGKEGYELEVGALQVKLMANQPAGIFAGLQTLRQLTTDKGAVASVQACKVVDYPRFGWRGLMLDVSRHFFTKDEVKAYIDLMAQYKFNVLHWHLTDDNGWRIEIKSLPKLTQVGAWRVARYGNFGDREDPKPGEPTPYGGFYTHEDIKEVVAYAAERQVTIVPEIDVPGHSMAALAAYPELSTKKEPKFVNPGTMFAEWYGDGKFKMLIENTLNPADENVYTFLDKVFTEVAALFPGQYIHMGGDECYHGYWEEDPSCKALMAKEGLKDTHELQSYFVKRVEKIIQAKGKTMMGWDEILEGGLAPNAAVMSWRGMKGGEEAAKQKHNVVMSPSSFAYIDYIQGDPSVEKPIYASLSLRKTYEFEPLPAGVDPQYILGGQANLWSEQIQNYRHATYMTYPRAWAIAESVWSPKENKNFDNFVLRAEAHTERMKAQGIKVATTYYEPVLAVTKSGEDLTISATTEYPGIQVRYCIDDSHVDEFSPILSANTVIPKGNIKFKTQSFKDGKPIGRTLVIPRADLEKRVK